jgi:uncharacterized protein with NRDE domain
MCPVLILNQVRSDFPVVLATNRDEFFARAASPAVRLLDAPRAVGGRDLVKGGAWMGVTEQGVFVGVTNQRTSKSPDPAKRSRGELVMEALRAKTPNAIEALLSSVDGRAYNPFNLLFGDAHELKVAYGREQSAALQIETVPPGLHVLPNDRLDCADFPKVARARQLLASDLQAPFEALRDALITTLADRARPALEDVPEPALHPFLTRAMLRELSALCIRTETYGTRSSTIVALAQGRVAHYLYADGPPDRASFADVLGLYA